jgi:hypothetical protein
MRLLGEILQERGVHRPLEPDVQLGDVALGERDDVHAGAGEPLEETGGVFLVAAFAARQRAGTPSESSVSPEPCRAVLSAVVKTISATSSISIHLLANDTPCVWRHRFDPASGAVTPFRSGYANAPYPADESQPSV